MLIGTRLLNVLKKLDNMKPPTIRATIAFLLVFLCFFMFNLILFIKITPENKDIMLYLLGALSSLLSIIVSYYFGSSHVPTPAKDDTLPKEQP